MARWPFAHLWDKALNYEQFVRASTQHCEMWTGVYRTARVPDALVAEAAALGGRFRLLAVVEDWCGDASNTVPVIARWVEKLPNAELRLVRRDEQFDLMGGYLTGKSRSVPIVVVLTEAMEEIGHWGPRPADLQAWVLEQKRVRAGKELYPEVRAWYAKDKGETTLRELLAVMKGPSAVGRGPSSDA